VLIFVPKLANQFLLVELNLLKCLKNVKETQYFDFIWLVLVIVTDKYRIDIIFITTGWLQLLFGFLK
jgi:hypothetical protein